MANIKVSALPVLTTPASNTQQTFFFVTDTSTGTPTSKRLTIGSINTFLSNNSDKANSAFANAAFDHANAAFGVANTGGADTYARNTANAAFAAANLISGVNTTQNNSITVALNTANAAFAVANAGGAGTDTYARNTANAGFLQANTPSHTANSAAIYANGAFAAANVSAGIDVTQNNSITVALNTANAAFAVANAGGGAGIDIYARDTANAGFLQANTPSYTANSAAIYANGAFATANNNANNISGINSTQNNSITVALNTANAAFAAANAGGAGTDTYARNTANAAFAKANTGITAQTRTTVSTTTASLASNATANAIVTMAKGYVLYKIQVSTGSWVTLSGNTTLANIDFARSISTDPAPGSGVIAESITAGTGANVTYFTPAVFGYNDDTSVSSNAYLRIYNNSGTTNTVNVTLTFLPMES